MRLDKRIHIAIRSYKRAGMVTTAKLIPQAFIWIPQSEMKDYAKFHDKAKLIGVPKRHDGNSSRKSNYILNNAPKPWVIVVDDDIGIFGMYDEGKKYVLRPEEVVSMINRGFILASQLGIRLWGVNQLVDPLAYRANVPISFLVPVLGPFTGHVKSDIRYDEKSGSKDDYDIFLQHIHKYRRVLRMNKFHYTCDHGEMKGGLTSYRTKQYEMNSINSMKKKWGDVYRCGESRGAGRREEGNILNSQVRVPIPGV
jgi:hypothetical protein